MKRITIALTSTNVLKRLAAVNTEEANKALRGAVHRMVMRGRLDILWHHADEPRAVSIGTTMRLEKNTEEAAPTRSTHEVQA